MYVIVIPNGFFDSMPAKLREVPCIHNSTAGTIRCSIPSKFNSWPRNTTFLCVVLLKKEPKQLLLATQPFGKFLKTLKEKIFEKVCTCDRCVLPFIKGKTYETTKVSFDGGRTWNIPKVVDPSGQSKHLFKCNIDDVEHCSFQKASSYLES